MRTIKLYSTNPKINSVKSFFNYIALDQSLFSYDFQWDENSPDYILTTTGYIFDQKERRNFHKIRGNAAIRIFFANEYFCPDFNLFDYAVGWDRKLINGKRYIQIPTFYNFNINAEQKVERKNNYSYKEALDDVKNRRFCNFIYSNPDAHPMRDKLFYSISNYKQVDSLGMHLHNMEIESSRYEADWSQISIELKANYKFSIAAENCCADGYATEKLITSFIAHSVPIYFGDPFVFERFNKYAFLNVLDYCSTNELISKIKEIDASDELWAEMVSQPWQTKKQEEEEQHLQERYLDFWNDLFADSEIKRPIGTVPHNYESFLMKKRLGLPKLSNLMKKLKKIPHKLRHYWRIMKK